MLISSYSAIYYPRGEGGGESALAPPPPPPIVDPARFYFRKIKNYGTGTFSDDFRSKVVKSL